MDDTNKSPEKPKSDQVRVPSPGSVSSVHSIRPLEWDSGADIGYQNTTQTDLSTVERMALANGSVSLLKTNETTASSTNKSKIGNPLAESSPFIRVLTSQPTNVNPKSTKPLVDYSISSDYSLDEHSSLQQLLVLDAPKSKTLGKEKTKSENSKSMEDLRIIRQANTLNGRSKSRSSQNVSSGEKTQKRYASSSSVSTVIPRELNPRVSNKSIQVDENSLMNLLCRGEFYQRDDCSTYTIDSGHKSRLSDRDIHSNSESVDGGSFEYVPGSQYNSNRQVTGSILSNSSSSGVNTMSSEIVNAVDLLKEYVDGLNITNKKKVIKKVAQTLMKQVDQTSSSEKRSAQGSIKSLKFPTNLPPPPTRTFHYPIRVESSSQLVVNSDMVFEPIDKPNRIPVDEVDKSSVTSKFESTSVDDAKTSESISNEIIGRKQPKRSGWNKSRILESSDFSRSSTSIKTAPNSTNDSNSYAVSCTENSIKGTSNVYSLKQYLAKEREAQLLWIKSGIDHLNNLKKLYESQKMLKKNLATFKKPHSTKPNSTTTSESDPKSKRVSSESHKPKRTPKSARKSIQTSTSDLNADSSQTINITSHTIITEHHQSTTNQKRISTKKPTVKKYCKKLQLPEKKDCECRNCDCCGKKMSSENKENVDENAGKPKSQRYGSPQKSVSKKPISYTVLFDKSPCHDKTVHIKRHTVRKSFSKVIYFGTNKPRVVPQQELNFKPLDSNQCPSLQEYLLKNKPDYVDRAEFRRQCLLEIAQLRELRDKSKNELMSLIQNSDESDINTVRRHLPPPPLSVMRIFNDRAIRKQTKEKYQQLPEVQMKRLQQKRRENNRSNQIMAKVFTKKLQRKVLKGQVNLANSVSVISN